MMQYPQSGKPSFLGLTHTFEGDLRVVDKTVDYRIEDHLGENC
jgi:hypothetical protein